MYLKFQRLGQKKTGNNAEKAIIIIYDSYVQSHLKLTLLFHGLTLEEHFALAYIWLHIRK